jgi:hypothetical protein
MKNLEKSLAKGSLPFPCLVEAFLSHCLKIRELDF